MKRDWLKILSNGAVIIGLIVLIYELNQSRQLGRADLLHSDYSDILAHNFTLMGDDAAAAIAVARTNPEQLSEEQRIVVDAHLRALFVRLDSYGFLSDRTGIYDKETAFEAVPRILETYFNYEYARDWWKRERTVPRPWATELYAIFDNELGLME